MPLQNMKAIETVTVGAGGAASIDFTNIPQTYTDLVVKLSLRQSGYTGVTWDWLKFRFNGSSATVYSSRDLEGNGSNAYSNTFTSQNGMVKLGLANSTTSTSNTFSNNEIYIPNYTGSNNKSVSGDGVHEDNATAAISVLGAGLWADSAAITSISFFPENGTAWVQYSTATLYGVSNTIAGGAKAYGGTVTEDTNYFYHTFRGTGTFTPTQNLTADILTIAGGGGATRGGGGAGGLLYSASQSLSNATVYTCTVGGGGAAQTSGTNSTVTGSGFTTLTATGGGNGSTDTGGTGSPNGGNGGSGGGGDWNSNGGTGSQGNNGGNGGKSGYPNEGMGGGGGAGAAGGNGTSGGAGGNGGNGSSTYSSWGLATNTGQNISGTYWYAGGGAGWGRNSVGTAGNGGGGGPANEYTPPNAISNTGGGGGGNNGTGGSGIVIIRYAK